MSRVEKILKVMLGRETKLPTPQSRVEELLIDLKTTYDSSSGAISGLDSRLTTAETEIEGLKDDLDEEVANLAGDISDNQDSIKANGTAIQTLQEQVARIQNPLIIKDIVDDVNDLPVIAEPGWVYFVQLSEEGSEHDSYEEFVYTTDSQWESLGPMKVDLVPYVKFTDYATNDKAGVVKVLYGNNDNGVVMLDDGVIALEATTETEVNDEKETRTALHPNNIPMFMKNYGIESKTFIADNFVKRIVSKKTGPGEKAYIKIAEIKTGNNYTERITFIITGLNNYGSSDIPVILVTINEREAAGQHSYARMLSAASTNSYKIGLVRRSDNVTEVWCGSEDSFNGKADVLILNSGSETTLFYDVQRETQPEGFTEIPIETVTTSSDFATSDEVTNMLNEVFDTSATAVSDEEASDMEVLSYEE